MDEAACVMCGLGRHKFQWPDWSDADRHEANALACATRINEHIDRLLDLDDPEQRVILRREIERAVDKLGAYIDSARYRLGSR